MEPKDQQETCTICLLSLASGGRGKVLLRTKCDHVFHRSCLLEWLRNGQPGKCCPLCKTPTLMHETIPVAFGKHGRPTRRSSRIRAKTEAPSAVSQTTSVPTPTPNVSNIPAPPVAPAPPAAAVHAVPFLYPMFVLMPQQAFENNIVLFEVLDLQNYFA